MRLKLNGVVLVCDSGVIKSYMLNLHLQESMGTETFMITLEKLTTVKYKIQLK